VEENLFLFLRRGGRKKGDREGGLPIFNQGGGEGGGGCSLTFFARKKKNGVGSLEGRRDISYPPAEKGEREGGKKREAVSCPEGGERGGRREGGITKGKGKDRESFLFPQKGEERKDMISSVCSEKKRKRGKEGKDSKRREEKSGVFYSLVSSKRGKGRKGNKVRAAGADAQKGRGRRKGLRGERNRGKAFFRDKKREVEVQLLTFEERKGGGNDDPKGKRPPPPRKEEGGASHFISGERRGRAIIIGGK